MIQSRHGACSRAGTQAGDAHASKSRAKGQVGLASEPSRVRRGRGGRGQVGGAGGRVGEAPHASADQKTYDLGNAQYMKASKRPARAVVKRFLRQNPTATNDQVVKSLGVSSRLVTLARSELALEGRPVRAGSDFTSPLAKVEDGELAAMELLGIKELEAGIKARAAVTGKPVTVEEQILILSDRIKDPTVPSQVLGGLVTVLQRLRPPDKARVGPLPPLDDPAKIKRLSLLIQACHPTVVQGALVTAGYLGQVTLAERKDVPDPQDQEKHPVAPLEPGATAADYAAAAGLPPGPGDSAPGR